MRAAFFGLAAAVLTLSAASAHEVQIPPEGWVCRVGYPKPCLAYDLKHPPSKVFSNPVIIYLGGNGTGYQEFRWETRK